MAGYTKNRDKNYEIKYLRKVLRQVDDRIRVPESVSGDSLRHLLDNVEASSVREAVSRRPRWLSLQSGIAYAAAFALVVALFYSTRLYRPDMISDMLSISPQEASEADSVIPAAMDKNNDALDINDAGVAAQIQSALDETAKEPAPASEAEPETNESGGSPPDEERYESGVFGLGGGGKATLVLKRGEYSFFWRENDINDPDRSSPVSLEVVDSDTHEIITQEDMPLAYVTDGFDFDNSLVFVGESAEGAAAIYSYDVSLPDEPVAQNSHEQHGGLLAAKAYGGVVLVVSASDTVDPDIAAEPLPFSVSDEAFVISLYDPVSLAVVTKQFTGAAGVAVLDDSEAFIVYTGQVEDGEPAEYTAQILFDGMDIVLGEAAPSSSK